MNKLEKLMLKYNEVWEGWTVQDFIDELEPQFNRIMENQSWYELTQKESEQPFKDKSELREWCKDNQPYYKKHIPEVYEYFLNKTNL